MLLGKRTCSLYHACQIEFLDRLLVSTYTFPLAVELLLVPLLTVIVMMDTVARLEEEHVVVATFTSALLAATGLTVLGFAFTKAALDYGALGSMHTVRKVLLAPILSLLFSPFLYALMLVAAYEMLFVNLEVGVEKDDALKRYAKRKVLLHCRWSLRRLHDFWISKGGDLTTVSSMDDVDRLLAGGASDHH